MSTLKLPVPSMPMCVRVVARDFEGHVIEWRMGEAHPLSKSFTVARMLIRTGESVEVYAHAESRGTRHTIPWERVLLVEEVLDVDTFSEELAARMDPA